MLRTLVLPEKTSTEKMAIAVLREAKRLRVLDKKARRKNRGNQKGRRSGPVVDPDIFVREACSRMLAAKRVSAKERLALDRALLLIPPKAASSFLENRDRDRLEVWRSSRPGLQLGWEETWDNWAEAQRIVRMIVRAGGMSVRSVLQKRGISRWRFAELAPLIGANPRIGFDLERNRFMVFPEGSPELAARIAKLNASVEKKIRAALARRR